MIIKTFSPGEEIAQPFHLTLTRLLRQYAAVGGMPEVVQAHIRGTGIKELERIKHAILDTLKLDFHKYTKKTNPKLLTIILDALPLHVGKKLKYTGIDRSYKSNEMAKALHQLCLAKVVFKVFNSGCNGVPLGAEKRNGFSNALCWILV